MFSPQLCVGIFSPPFHGGLFSRCRHLSAVCVADLSAVCVADLSAEVLTKVDGDANYLACGFTAGCLP